VFSQGQVTTREKTGISKQRRRRREKRVEEKGNPTKSKGGDGTKLKKGRKCKQPGCEIYRRYFEGCELRGGDGGEGQRVRRTAECLGGRIENKVRLRPLHEGKECTKRPQRARGIGAGVTKRGKGGSGAPLWGQKVKRLAWLRFDNRRSLGKAHTHHTRSVKINRIPDGAGGKRPRGKKVLVDRGKIKKRQGKGTDRQKKAFF